MLDVIDIVIVSSSRSTTTTIIIIIINSIISLYVHVQNRYPRYLHGLSAVRSILCGSKRFRVGFTSVSI